MIPKRIHYCWFGRGPLPELCLRCIDSWKRFLPEWEVMRWDEDTFDASQNAFTRDAYEQRKFAFVSDYVRAWALFHQGGVYLDTDLEIRRSLDEFLSYPAFTGFEHPGLPFTALWGSACEHGLARRVLAEYETRRFSVDEPPNTEWISDLIVDHYGIDRDRDELQVGQDASGEQLALFPSTHFCLDLPANYCCHHFHGSWVRVSRPWKAELHARYHLSQAAQHGAFDTDSLEDLAARLRFGQVGRVALLKTVGATRSVLRRAFGTRRQ